jgi:hypothetical protein
MARLPSIPETEQHKVLVWTAEGKTQAQCVELLKSECGITTSVTSVYRLLQKTRQGRQEIAKALYAEEIQKTAVQDIKIMSDIIQTYYKEWKETKNKREQLRMAAELRMWIRDKMAISGLHDDTDFTDEIAAKDEFIDELNKLKN